MTTHTLVCDTQFVQETPQRDPIPQMEVTEIETEQGGSGSGKKMKIASPRAEIDTSAPFESVKEATNRFGGFGLWKPQFHKPGSDPIPKHDIEAIDIASIEKQAFQLEKDMIAKERETLDVLRELQTTKLVVEDLKLKLQEQAAATFNDNFCSPHLYEDKENLHPPSEVSDAVAAYSPPESILSEMKQAQLKLSRTTNDLETIQATLESLNKEKTVLLPMLSAEAEQYKQMSAAARAEVHTAVLEIEQTKTKIDTAEKRFVAAQKMKEAAKATEAVALAEIKALLKHERSERGVTLSLDEANVARMEMLKKVQDASREVRSREKLLEEALTRVEAANTAKTEVEEALSKWKSNHKSSRLEEEGDVIEEDESKSVLGATAAPSIGQILRNKLLLAKDFENGRHAEKSGFLWEKTLGEMLGRPKSEWDICNKRKKAGLAKFSGLMRRQSMKRKKQDLGCSQMM